MQRAISRGWDNAVNLAYSLSSIDWNEAAALEYLGPPGYNEPFQSDIQAVFKNAATFGQGSRGVPSFFKWKVYVRCDDRLGMCKKLGNAAAYTENRIGGPDGDRASTPGERKSSVTVINYCPRYFTYKRLHEKIDENKNEDNRIRLNLDWYRANTGYVTLHELMHSDIVSYKANGERHVYDQQFRLKGDNDRRDVYGASMCKILSKTDDPDDLGKDVSSNADNFAQYALAKAVQKKIEVYPHLPIITKENLVPGSVRSPYGQLLTIANNGHLEWNNNLTAIYVSPTEPDSDFTCDNMDNRCDTPRNSWLSAAKTQSTLPDLPTSEEPSPDTGDQTLHCFRDALFFESQASAPQPFVQTSIDTACNLFNGITLDVTNQSQLIMPYAVPNTDNNVWLWAAWNAGDPICAMSRTVTAVECKTMLSTALNGCDTDTIDPKYGGANVNECVVWGMSVNGSPLTPE